MVVFWPEWIYLGLSKNHLWFSNFKNALQFETTILSFDAFHAKPIGEREALCHAPAVVGSSGPTLRKS
jgi:hypothetical protein